MKDDKFSLLDDVRELDKKNDNPLTVSLGIGKGITSSILRTSELAYNALNIAMSRGGDQIVVNSFGSPLEYYGSKIEIKLTRSHVRGRVLASSLANIIKNSSNVLIMGHAMSDFDAVGASLGAFAIAKAYKKPAYLIYKEDSIEIQAKRAIKNSFTNEEISKYCVSPNKANQLIDDKTLLIVVDTHIPQQTIAPQVLDKCNDVCVIDHHRRSDVFIDNPIFQYHEPQSSSASELVSELLYYQPSHVDVDVRIANFLLSGICLDTKFFRSSTSGKTFEMAMILKQYQASVESVNEFFKEEYFDKFDTAYATLMKSYPDNVKNLPIVFTGGVTSMVGFEGLAKEKFSSNASIHYLQPDCIGARDNKFNATVGALYASSKYKGSLSDTRMKTAQLQRVREKSE